MERIIAAFGLKDDYELTDKHFGDSVYFDIFEVRENDIRKVKRIKNVKIEEKMHGDPKKATKIGDLLKEANVLFAFRMGPNILRMKKNFVPVIVNSKNIDEVKKALKENFEKIFTETEKRGEKNYITLKVKEDKNG